MKLRAKVTAKAVTSLGTNMHYSLNIITTKTRTQHNDMQ